MDRTSIFFRSDLFQPDQEEMDYASREKPSEFILTNSLSRFLIRELAKSGYDVHFGDETQEEIYNERCRYLLVEHDDPFDLGLFCGSHLDGHGILVHPEHAYTWKRFRRYHADPVALPLFETVVRLLNETEGISELEFGFSA